MSKEPSFKGYEHRSLRKTISTDTIYISFVPSGPGRQVAASSGPSKPRRAAPGYPSQQQGPSHARGGTSSSLNRYAQTHKQPSLPRSGAQHLARGPSNFDVRQQEFMRTPESGVCG